MCDETGFGLKKTKRNRITVFRSANRFPVYRLQHYIFVMTFEFVFIYRHIYRKWGLLVDSNCWNTFILTGLTYTLSRKMFYDGCAKKGIFFPPNIE